ncbi:MAG: UDP-N-acetylglucosamine 2-epimerase (non-hydrolyzing) [bacterium (Candidatus Ratteibacteria) CG15_BIG_FIL_POST_REV_8_21_14_020_41_12]|uniref:UDP-N-acetylglucosamine 2-epimerase (Non-hydrolyzing) n=1 Tax=bacterium (Candidatus Ratteibacteria) CG15_BIG_FIL_POST_REV_8_21_14_020_41_12 TaxID=2014291 RepID=A0A2M7GUX6_9BACT|nr:MAG: UDP-N-acetylglucosamine 2-epimerase (non-hydrolyzing) [bacterium (Candidatus Ratteibacteria) CG15_BIG_FIL_POST_REV_8_21_14_020_41_12]
MKIVLVAGARPNFMKIAPIIQAIKNYNRQHKNRIRWQLVHTGQHYDYIMSKVFFKDLEIPQPDIYLGVGSGTHSQQTARVMMEFEKVLFREKPNLVMVVGDVNSTLAAALSAAKLNIPIAHIEAGLRSYDRRMPEEINRVVVDVLADYLFTPTIDANENLKKEGIPKEKIFLVGDVMVDTLLKLKTKSQKSKILRKLNLRRGEYALLTLHRPSNVDYEENFLKIISALKEISRRIPIVFPAHPRTRKNMEKFKMGRIKEGGIHLLEPLGYLDFLQLMMNSKFVMTDSGGMQEETTVLNIPCLTLRDTTERPMTITQGTNILVGNDTKKIIKEAEKILNKNRDSDHFSYPALWDGKAAERIVSVIATMK